MQKREYSEVPMPTETKLCNQNVEGLLLMLESRAGQYWDYVELKLAGVTWNDEAGEYLKSWSEEAED